MGSKDKVPDAWEDDWESAADREDEAPAQQGPPPEPMSRAERLARHAESNRRLWESAETPSEPAYFLASAATGNVPLATGFRPAMKVLSRKPAPRMVARRDPVTGLERLTLAGGDDDDDDDDGAQKAQPTPEEIRMRQQRELEEKQRRYEEARAKIFGGTGAAGGSNSNNGGGRGSRPSTPGTVTPPEGRQGHRGKGRGRGGFRGDNHGRNDRSDSHGRRAGSQPGGGRELYDPSYAPKPGLATQKRGGEGASPARAGTPREEDQALRGPRGPDGSGRGGFGFARGGAKEG